MKAFRFESYGAPDVLSMKDVETPVPGSGEVLIKLHAAGVNPSDVKTVAGRFHSALPRTPGRDFAGVVASAGEVAGKQVWGSGAGFGVTRDGTHAQYVTMPVSWLAEKPANLSMAQAAAVGVPYVTAWTALADAANVKEDEIVLITGVSGAVGSAAAQIAHWRGARVIGVGLGTRPPGADEYIDSAKENVVERVKALTGSEGVDVALDTVGGPLFEISLRSLRIGGRKVVMTAQGNGRVEFNVADFYHNRSHMIGIDTVKLTGEQIAGIMAHLKAGFESGSLRPPAIEEHPFDQAMQVYQDLDAGRTSTKQVLIIS
jgi:NADPH:quinone reductase